VWAVLSLFVLAVPLACPALHPFYEQNGDAYLMIGDGPFRGVYALNNLTGGGVQYLYDAFDAYGITANQIWDGASKKQLFTFAGLDTGWTPVTGNISRAVNTVDWEYSRMNYPGERTDERIITSYHCGWNYESATGIGPHGFSDYVTLHYMWGIYGYNGDYPCFWLPTPDPAKPGNCLVGVGKYYHTFMKVRDYTLYFGGWTHWVARENIEAKYRILDLYEYKVNTRTGPAKKMHVADVKTAEKSTMDKIHECPDGCSRAQAGIPLPGAEVPYVDCVYSSRLNNAYLYQREPSSPIFDLTGVTAGCQVVGIPANLTTKALGLSSKDASGDYVYVIGKDLINTWLAEANAPFRIDQLDDVAVSDQWWMRGGIVYALDRSQKKVYKFVRDEITGAVSIPEQIVVYDGGVMPDSVSADGFGHLYLVKTTYIPENPPESFKPADAASYEPQVDIFGNITYRAHFDQKVYKAVHKRDYYTKTFSVVPGKVLLGTNTFFRDFKTLTPTAPSSWVWISDPVQYGPIVQTEYRTELAVINNSTPPRVNRRDAVCDVDGPMLSTSGGLVMAAPDSDGYFSDAETYLISVENAPDFDANGVNTGSLGEDTDHDLRVGDFPATLKKSSLSYQWKVLQTKDLYGVDISPNKVIMNATSDKPRLPLRLGGGEYKAGCKIVYRYYDYDNLPLGTLADGKESVLSAEQTAYGEDSDQFSWTTFKIKPVPLVAFPGGSAMLMSGRPVSGGYKYRPDSPEDSGSTYCSALNEYPLGARFVVPERFTNWSFSVRESTYNTSRGMNRIDLILATNPPDPGDPKMVTGTLEWLGRPKFTWTANLLRGAEGISNRQLITEDPFLTAGQVRTLFPIPSQPRAYSVTLRGGRSYQYETFIPVTKVIGGEIITNWEQTTFIKSIDVAADCEVVLTDETGPMMAFTDPFEPTNTVPGFLWGTSLMYGTTGETLAQTENPPTANPTVLEYVVADNNPFGNDTASDNLALLTYEDPFHFGGEPRCKVSHSPFNRRATFAYTTAGLGIVPNSGLMDEYSSDPTQANGSSYKVSVMDIIKSEFEKGWNWLKPEYYNKAFSYRIYRIDTSSLDHFSSLTKTAKSPQMDLAYANNVAGYMNLEFGLGWTESCKLATPTVWQGSIVIRDNDRPNAFVQAKELKNKDALYFAPTNVNTSSFIGRPWVRYAEGTGVKENHNGDPEWSGDDIQGFAFPYRLGPKVLGKLVSVQGAEMEVDVPTFFKAIVSDNTGEVATKTFQLLAEDGNTSLEDYSGQGDTIRTVFRKPTSSGKYEIRLEIEDKALDWPPSWNNPTVADPKHNTRTLKATFPVYDTRLDVRVIEQKREGH